MTSVDVPPPSQVTTGEAGVRGDHRGAERAGGRPGQHGLIGWWTTSSADSTPPLDRITENGMRRSRRGASSRRAMPET